MICGSCQAHRHGRGSRSCVHFTWEYVEDISMQDTWACSAKPHACSMDREIISSFRTVAVMKIPNDQSTTGQVSSRKFFTVHWTGDQTILLPHGHPSRLVH